MHTQIITTQIYNSQNRAYESAVAIYRDQCHEKLLDKLKYIGFSDYGLEWFKNVF